MDIKTLNLPFADQGEVFSGSRQIQVKDPGLDIFFPVLIHYPTHQPSRPTTFSPYTQDVSTDSTIAQGRFPLIIISHGSGGSHLLYTTISTYLAKNGYIVAMLEHYGNNRNNNQMENTIENLVNRPKHTSLTIDALQNSGIFGNSIENSQIAVIGHSMGGFTALALAGAIPRTREAQKVDCTPDERVKAIVLLAPAIGWFMNGMDNVKVPILMLSAEHDQITPSWNAEMVIKSIPNKSLLTFRTVENAGHFSFLSPFPLNMRKPDFIPSTDPDGFDREEFHRQLPAEILLFLNEKLTVSGK